MPEQHDCPRPMADLGDDPWVCPTCRQRWEPRSIPDADPILVRVPSEHQRKGPRPATVIVNHVCTVPISEMVLGSPWRCACGKLWTLDSFMRPREIEGEVELRPDAGSVEVELPPRTGKTVAKWADAAMVTAEPHDGTTPKCYLIGATADPLGELASMNGIYTGKVFRSLSEVTNDDRHTAWEEVMKTRIQTPLEAIQFHFLFENVTRAFTHQLVRTRNATYAQESLRFAVKEGAPVALPPSLQGERKDDAMRVIWEAAVDKEMAAYNMLVDSGMPAEDARGLLPTNVLTRIHVVIDLRNLIQLAGNRLCTQAQFEWRAAISEMVRAIREHGDDKGDWQFKLISEIFRPVCYLTGKCEFQSKMDRPCSIRGRVDAFEQYGVKPEDWDVGARINKSVYPEPELYIDLLPIQPVEWLADPNAAR